MRLYSWLSSFIVVATMSSASDLIHSRSRPIGHSTNKLFLSSTSIVALITSSGSMCSCSLALSIEVSISPSLTRNSNGSAILSFCQARFPIRLLNLHVPL